MSDLLTQLMQNLQNLPGVGPATARRMAYFLLQKNREKGCDLAKSLEAAMTKIKFCNECRSFTEHNVCNLCLDPKRKKHQVCVVEQPIDVFTFEKTGHYQGSYFVLHGQLSPIEGIGPSDLHIDKLVNKIYNAQNNYDEIILATSPTYEGEATAHWIIEKLKDTKVTCSRIAFGVPCGGELDGLDAATIARALQDRQQV